MARFLIFSDVHWGRTSSIIRRQGKKYSIKLEHLIQSMNFVLDQAKQKNCEFLICAGDMFDKSICTDEELTALSEIKWTDLPCYFLCGNHESSVDDLRYSSVFALLNGANKDKLYFINQDIPIKLSSAEVHFLPYISEITRQELHSYLTEQDKTKTQILISHNDLKGINYGGIESQLGFTVNEIEANCDVCFNGHIHNAGRISKKILNVGSLSAHNFTNDSFKYKYGCWVIDTDDLSVEFIENPYSFNFYKVDVLEERDLNQVSNLKNNAVVSVRTKTSLAEEVQEIIAQQKETIVESRIVPIQELAAELTAENPLENLSMDHLAEFIIFCKAALTNTNVLQEELSAICK